MFPEAVAAPFIFIVQAATALFLDKAFPFAGAVNHDDAQLRVNLPLSIPKAAGRTDLDLCRDYQFLFCIHRGVKRVSTNPKSVTLSDGSIKRFV